MRKLLTLAIGSGILVFSTIGQAKASPKPKNLVAESDARNET